MKKHFSLIKVLILIWISSQLQSCNTPEINDNNTTTISLNTTSMNTTSNTTLMDTTSVVEMEYVEDKLTLEDLESDIKNLIGEDLDYISLIYYEVDSGDLIEINPDYSVKSASTYKVPLNMFLYDKILKGEMDIDTTISYTSSDYEYGAGILQDSDELNHPLSLSTLSEYSIRYSDNIAANMIVRYLGFYNFIEYMEQVSNVDITDVNYITPRIMFEFLKKLYINSENNPHYNTLIEHMKNTIFHDRIDALIPQEIVAHKIGDYEEFVNDVGLIYTDKPYILIFYTNGFKYETIAEISKIIYEYNTH